MEYGCKMNKFIALMMLMAGGSLKWIWGGYTGGDYCLTVASFLLDPPTGEPCY